MSYQVVFSHAGTGTYGFYAKLERYLIERIVNDSAMEVEKIFFNPPLGIVSIDIKQCTTPHIMHMKPEDFIAGDFSRLTDQYNINNEEEEGYLVDLVAPEEAIAMMSEYEGKLYSFEVYAAVNESIALIGKITAIRYASTTKDWITTSDKDDLLKWLGKLESKT